MTGSLVIDIFRAICPIRGQLFLSDVTDRQRTQANPQRQMTDQFW